MCTTLNVTKIHNVIRDVNTHTCIHILHSNTAPASLTSTDFLPYAVKKKEKKNSHCIRFVICHSHLASNTQRLAERSLRTQAQPIANKQSYAKFELMYRHRRKANLCCGHATRFFFLYLSFFIFGRQYQSF